MKPLAAIKHQPDAYTIMEMAQDYFGTEIELDWEIRFGSWHIVLNDEPLGREVVEKIKCFVAGAAAFANKVRSEK